MSGTRSHSPRAQVTEALIVSHGQPSDPGPAEAALAASAQSVEALLPGWRVQSATLAAPEAITRAFERMGSEPFVYPFFMSDGWFTQQALPRALGERGVRMLPPLGIDPALVPLAAQVMTAEAERRNWPLPLTSVLLAAHGSSRSPNAARAACDFAEALAGLLPVREIRPCFIEQDPAIASAASGMRAMSLCLPFFSSAGEHVAQDIPAALRAAGFPGGLLPALGQDPGVPGLIAGALTRAAVPECTQ